MDIMGLGHDVVNVETFGGQLAGPGSHMGDLFSPRELRQCHERARLKGDDEAVHLSARWAGKEAVLKAWSAALGSGPAPYTIDRFPWAAIEILDDSRSRPGVYLSDRVNARLYESVACAGSLSWLISLTHDGPVASAVVMLGSLHT
ncbi:holo-ACP synthase [Bifidobacterium xylocopae]|uniref:4'-phosphopantetheinyl transferase n=1 Tax=Bifidobacterium xylocopae TaxID=2493119 RepID=A0A366KC97_9BIFI|nr:holo-ACP synthase [Bifidobacterium xylocopae]RBP99350.1 4'-phosphopantetheinyl transferase [Bifidobacterium xylocopae]